MLAGITLGVVGAATLFLAAARLGQGRKRARTVAANNRPRVD
ncbi:hypothetical protein [Nannocystis bainbridge]|uniref:Uncharacterized protein n=1 Tax=Nannocystis bainbridge TaxID=2995303 RepID=A0ABT5EA40_9BACT|nr:hypothetical protein [Nannocystis bainbridge]MDC0722475.1 hypothetical protein [Nannocystis bainbridge]